MNLWQPLHKEYFPCCLSGINPMLLWSRTIARGKIPCLSRGLLLSDVFVSCFWQPRVDLGDLYWGTTCVYEWNKSIQKLSERQECGISYNTVIPWRLRSNAISWIPSFTRNKLHNKLKPSCYHFVLKVQMSLSSWFCVYLIFLSILKSLQLSIVMSWKPR